MRRMTTNIIFLITLFMSIAINAYCLSTAKLTLLVKNEQGVPVEGAKAYISYSKPETGGIGVADILKEGITGKDGLFTAESLTMSSVGLSAEKDGYYHGSIHYEFTSNSNLTNRWEPWNPTIEVVLKKKRNPVPMYSKYLEALTVPVLGLKVGYDLEIGDWVAPHGTGVVSDFVFLCENKYESFTSAETSCEIFFSNPEDGFQEFEFDKNEQSSFKWPYEAPANKYNIKKLNKWMSVHLPNDPYKSNYNESINYLFRVRSEVDSNGNIINANYGKLQGDIRVYKKAQVSFFYHFNPDGTRNLEEDPEKNLFE